MSTAPTLTLELERKKELSRLSELAQKYPVPNPSICFEDETEKEFDELVKLWTQNKISYERLMKNYPTYNMSVWRKLLTSLAERFP